MASQQKMAQFMRKVILDHVDSVTGEVNCTRLAEDAANHFDLDFNDARPYEVAYEVAIAYEKKSKKGRR